MTENIEKVLQRGERLEDLIDKTEDLEQSVSSTSNMQSCEYHHTSHCGDTQILFLKYIEFVATPELHLIHQIQMRPNFGGEN